MIDHDDEDDEHDEPDDAELLDMTKSKVITFSSKDRTVATVRMTDENGLCDLKIYLLLKAKMMQMEVELGVMEEHGERH